MGGFEVSPSPETIARLGREKLAREALAPKLAEFLASGPLYTHFAIEEDARGLHTLPAKIQLYCSNIECGKIQTFERVPWKPDSGVHTGWGLTSTYTCRNCRKQQQRYMYVWNDSGFWKVGQVPELLERIDAPLKNALGDSAKLYRKAVRSRSFGFGIGALSYLRRIVEDTTEILMDLLREEKWDEWNASDRQQFESARTTYQYSQKIEYAAEKVLPAAVFVNGRDSFTALHDVTSHGLHGLSEEDCLRLFDRCNLIFAHTFRFLAEHKREREEFAKELLALKRE